MKLYNYLFSFAILFLVKVYGYQTKYTLDVVKKLKADTCHSDKDCTKKYQTKCHIESGHKKGYCISTLYCHGNNDHCVYEVEQEKNIEENNPAIFVNYKNVHAVKNTTTNHDTQKPTLILESCNDEEAFMEKCTTRECEEDTQCFSGICRDKICITNEKKPLYLCSNNKIVFQGYDHLKDFKPNRFTCKLVEEEICQVNTDCATGSCQMGENAKICMISKSGNSLYILRIILEIILIKLLIIILIILIISCKKYKLYRKELKIKYEIEEIFLNDNNKAYIKLEDVDDYDIDEAQMKLNKHN